MCFLGLCQLSNFHSWLTKGGNTTVSNYSKKGGKKQGFVGIDQFSGYIGGVERVSGSDIDHGQIHKRYNAEPGKDSEHWHSPASIIRVTKKIISGEPKGRDISTTYVERQNLTMRMQMKRFTRVTNAFSKSLRHLEAALALHFFHYNFMRSHETIRVSPTIEAGISKHLWTLEEFLGFKKQEKEAA